MCSVSLDSRITSVEGTAAAEFEKGDEMPMERNAGVALEEVPGDLIIIVVFSVCLTALYLFVCSLFFLQCLAFLLPCTDWYG